MRHAAKKTFPLTIDRFDESMGRPSKGPRVSIMAKPAPQLAEIIKTNADAVGMAYGEYITAIVAESLGMPEYAPKPPRDRGNELPIRFEELPIPKVA